MNPRKLTDRVRLLNADTKAGYGGQHDRDWSAATPTEPLRALVEFVGSTETTDGRDTTVSSWSLVLMPDAPIDSHSRVLWAGADFPLEVDGEVGRVMRNGAVHYQSAVLVAAVDHNAEEAGA